MLMKLPAVKQYTDSKNVDTVKSPKRNACTGSDEAVTKIKM